MATDPEVIDLKSLERRIVDLFRSIKAFYSHILEDLNADKMPAGYNSPEARNYVSEFTKNNLKKFEELLSLQEQLLRNQKTVIGVNSLSAVKLENIITDLYDAFLSFNKERIQSNLNIIEEFVGS